MVFNVIGAISGTTIGMVAIGAFVLRATVFKPKKTIVEVVDEDDFKIEASVGPAVEQPETPQVVIPTPVMPAAVSFKSVPETLAVNVTSAAQSIKADAISKTKSGKKMSSFKRAFSKKTTAQA